MKLVKGNYRNWEYNVNLTQDKTYYVLDEAKTIQYVEESSKYLLIMDDASKASYYPKRLFRPIEEMREEKLNTILG